MPWYDIFQFPQLLRGSQVALNHDADPTPKDDVKLRKERGASGTDIDGSVVSFTDYNPAMRGEQFFNNVDMMRKADGAIRCVSQVIKLPLLRTTCQIVPQEEDADPQDTLIAQTVHEKLLGTTAMHDSWQQTLRNILLMFDFGFCPIEKVWDLDDEGFLHYSRLALRLPRSIDGFRVDSDGTLVAILQKNPNSTSDRVVRIPCPTYGAVFTWDKEGDDYFGQSIYRPMYKHWWYKEQLYRVDAVRLDRWGVGIPTAKIQKDYAVKPREEQVVKDVLRNLRANHQSWIYHPEEIEFGILAPSGQGGALGLMDSVNHHDTMIFRSVLAQFISTGNQAFGNYGSTKNYADMFLYAEQAAANFIEEEFTRQIIRPMVDFNFDMSLPNGKARPYPRLKFADVQKIDVKSLAEALARLTSGKLIIPDDDLESFIRKFAGWPKKTKGFEHQTPAEAAKQALATAQAKPGIGGRITSPASEGNRSVNQPKTE